MGKQMLIKKTIEVLSKLPENKVLTVADFANFILKKYDEELLQKGINHLVNDGNAFQFLNNEEELYSKDDLKELF